MKSKIENLEIKYTDIELMKNFIEYYENSQSSCDEYNRLCRKTRIIFNIPKEKDILEELNKRINRNLIEKIYTTDKNEYDKLEQEYKKLIEQYNLLSQYNKIIEINRKFDTNTINDYYEEKTSTETNFNQKHQKKSETSKFKKFKEQKSGIRVMYINIKYLYQVYKNIFEYNIDKKTPSIIKQIRLKRAIKQIKPILVNCEYNFANVENIENNMMFFKMYSYMIEIFNEEEGPKIISAINETIKIPSEINISKSVTIIGKRNNNEQILEERTNYVKTKSA